MVSFIMCVFAMAILQITPPKQYDISTTFLNSSRERKILQIVPTCKSTPIKSYGGYFNKINTKTKLSN